MPQRTAVSFRRGIFYVSFTGGSVSRLFLGVLSIYMYVCMYVRSLRSYFVSLLLGRRGGGVTPLDEQKGASRYYTP